MQKRVPEIDLDEAPTVAPIAMTDGAATRLARDVFGRRGAAVRNGVCSVGMRPGPHSRIVNVIGSGETWERAFDVALTAIGR